MVTYVGTVLCACHAQHRGANRQTSSPHLERVRRGFGYHGREGARSVEKKKKRLFPWLFQQWIEDTHHDSFFFFFSDAVPVTGANRNRFDANLSGPPSFTKAGDGAVVRSPSTSVHHHAHAVNQKNAKTADRQTDSPVRRPFSPFDTGQRH
jgi:hypothetical protein